METAYCERFDGIWQLWTYVESWRVYLKQSPEQADIVSYCRRHNYRLIWIRYQIHT